jgi:hypothetical protein
MCLFELSWICACEWYNSSSKSSGKAPEKGAFPQGICRFCRKAGHHMECVEFLKWLHRKGIPLRQGWTIRNVNEMSAKIKAIEALLFVISNDFYDSLVWCPYVPSLRRNFVLSTHILIIMDLVITLWMTNFMLLN